MEYNGLNLLYVVQSQIEEALGLGGWGDGETVGTLVYMPLVVTLWRNMHVENEPRAEENKSSYFQEQFHKV